MYLFFVCLFFLNVVSSIIEDLTRIIKRVFERDKMRGLSSILSLSRNSFNKFNDTGVQMLDSIYHMTLKLKSHFGVKTLGIGFRHI